MKPSPKEIKEEAKQRARRLLGRVDLMMTRAEIARTAQITTDTLRKIEKEMRAAGEFVALTSYPQVVQDSQERLTQTRDYLIKHPDATVSQTALALGHTNQQVSDKISVLRREGVMPSLEPQKANKRSVQTQKIRKDILAMCVAGHCRCSVNMLTSYYNDTKKLRAMFHRAIRVVSPSPSVNYSIRTLEEWVTSTLDEMLPNRKGFVPPPCPCAECSRKRRLKELGGPYMKGVGAITGI